MGIRPFIGSKDYKESRQFYTLLGFKEYFVSKNMSNFSRNGISFYLQDAYVKDWVDNTMVFWEVEDVEGILEEIESLKLSEKFKRVKLSKIQYKDWGKEFFLHDPAGILWHIGAFNLSSV